MFIINNNAWFGESSVKEHGPVSLLPAHKLHTQSVSASYYTETHGSTKCPTAKQGFTLKSSALKSVQIPKYQV